MPVINFVHIPKTAGTSFRLGAEEFYGEKAIAYDYGPESQQTSGVCLEHCYRSVEDRWAFVRACEASETRMVSGHFRADKYLPAFNVSNTVTFARDPVQRLVSEYGHFVRHNGYEDSFRDFYNLPLMRNRFSKLLQGVPVRAIGFVGLTEQYELSLQVFNQLFDADIPSLKENVGKKSVLDKHEVSQQDLDEVRRLNRADLEKYADIVELFETRVSMYRQDKPYTHGQIVQRGKKQVGGWAWSQAGSEPVKVCVRVNGKNVAEMFATEFRPNLCRLGVPRAGYVGWSVKVDLSEGDKVECFVAATGQVLGSFVFVAGADSAQS